MNLALVLFVAASCLGKAMQQQPEAATLQGASQYEVPSHDASANVDNLQMGPHKPASTVIIEAMGRRMVHNNLLMVGSKLATRRSENFARDMAHEALQGSSDWLIIILLLFLFIIIILLLYFISQATEQAAYKNSDLKPVVAGRPMDPFLDPSKSMKQASPMPQNIRASPAAQRLLPTGSGAFGGSPPQTLQPYSQGMSQTAASQGMSQTAAGSGSPLLQSLGLGSNVLSPVSTSRAAWATTPGVPPPLNPREVPPQNRKAYRVAVASLRRLYVKDRIEITSEFDYPQYYARLGAGAEGGRLEIAAEPSWRTLVATLGRLEYPATLSADAALYGPGREYYGPFQRYSGGFSLGHWSKGGGQVLTFMPRKSWTGGFFVDIKSDGREVASVQSIDNGQRYQIDIQGGVDNILILAGVLASFVASQPMIDESGTRV
jgi:hypothetical protein